MRKPSFFTFYSFKGGVGRSMALINTAAHLARRGRRVLAIDLDLEAPGISYLSTGSDANIHQQGFVDAIHGLLKTPEESPLVSSDPSQTIEMFTRSIDLTLLAQGDAAGIIQILPAGDLRDAAEYQRRLRAIDLAKLYREGVGVRVLERLKEVIVASARFDYVLVDSRTGLSTEAGIAVRDLADHLVVIMGLNHQNVTGTADFLKLIKAGQPQPISLTVVLSPVPLGEDDLAEQRIRVAEKAIISAWPGGIRTPLAQLQIPYHPRLAFQEQPHIARLTTRPLTQAYGQLERRVRELAADTPDAFAQEARTLIKEEQWAEAIAPLRELATFKSPSVRFMVAQVLREHSGDRVFDPYATILSEFAKDDSEAAILAGEHYADSNRIGRAERIVRTRLRAHPNDEDAWTELADWWQRRRGGLPRAKAISQEGLEANPSSARLHANFALFLFYACNDDIGAEPYYRRSIELEPDEPNWKGNYALFLWNAFRASSDAERLFLETLAIGSDANIHSNYAEILIGLGRYEAAKHHLEEAWSFRHGEHDFVTVETLFRAAVWCAIQGRRDEYHLRQLATIVRGRFRGEFVSFKRLFAEITLERDAHFYLDLSAVLSRQLRPSALNRYPKWRKLEALDEEEDLFPK